jgi:DNA polymerase-3 subunit epsilon
MSVLKGPLVFVDIETNGLSYSRGRIIEVAVVRVEDGQVSGTLNYLLNPGGHLPAFISGLTGITDADLARAPAFEDVADELMQMMDGAVFVAHNVRFDYSFLKHEFGRLGKKFNPRLLCTVKLSRTMYPDQRGHKLQDLIARCGLSVAKRHRAYDDAEAMWQFICHLQTNFPAELIDKAIAAQIKSPSLPKALSPGSLEALPDGPGVYIFEDIDGAPLYIGKSVAIRKRVLSHFSSDHSSESEFKISQTVAHIETIETAGELEALLLESRLIKDRQPLYNRQLRRTQKLTIARRAYSSTGYITVNVEDIDAIDPDQLGDILSVYTTKGRARQFLDELCKTYGFCPRLMGLEKGTGPCFASQLKKCRGACAGQVSSTEYNDLLLDVFNNKRLSKWPYPSPVLIQEISAANDDYRSIVIDKWCVLADISQPEDCEPTVRFHNRAFDIDTYRILKSFIDTKRHRLAIRPISLTSLQEMASINAY